MAVATGRGISPAAGGADALAVVKCRRARRRVRSEATDGCCHCFLWDLAFPGGL